MLNRVWVLVFCMVLGVSWAGGSIWVLINTPTSDTFNGISAPNSNFAIAVGENGSIVHFVDGDNGTLMPSGTTEELYDVYASSPNLAVATGEDVVLLWDGVSWSTLFTGSNDTIFTGTWISPEEDIVLYGYISSPFGGFICPKIPNDDTQYFCRGFANQLMLTACGNSNDIKLFTTAGNIYHLGNLLGDPSGSDPLHNEVGLLGLGGVWIPQDSCIPGPIAPLEAFAIRNDGGGEMWHFDGSGWNNMNVNVPADQTFTWVGGISSKHVTAVGFKPDNMGGNAGVVWHYDGITWTEDTTLPVGTPGLTDIAASVSAPDNIFINGFDSNNIRMGGGDLASYKARITAEWGYIAGFDENVEQFTDIRVTKSQDTAGPFGNGDSITYKIEIENLGTATATEFLLIDRFTKMNYVNDDCDFNFLPINRQESEWEYYETQVPSLAPGMVKTCIMELTVNGEKGDEIINEAYVAGLVDYNYSNNGSQTGGIFIQ